MVSMYALLLAPAAALVARGPLAAQHATRSVATPMMMRTSIIGGNWCVVWPPGLAALTARGPRS